MKITKARLMEIVKEELAEVLNPKDGAGAYVKDFKKSKAPQFKGKSDGEKRKMAVAAYLQDKEEAELKEEELEEGWFGFGDETEKQTKKTDAMIQRASDTLGRFSGEKVKKPKPSPDEELQQMSDKEESDDALLALKKKMGLAEKENK